MIDAWQSGNFVSYSKIDSQHDWSLPLVKGWRDHLDRSQAEKAAWQWASITEKFTKDLTAEQHGILAVSYESLLSNPVATLKSVCEFSEVPFGPKMQEIARAGFPLSKLALSPPSEDKWKAREKELTRLESVYQGAAKQLRDLIKSL